MKMECTIIIVVLRICEEFIRLVQVACTYDLQAMGSYGTLHHTLVVNKVLGTY